MGVEERLAWGVRGMVWVWLLVEFDELKVFGGLALGNLG